MKLKLKSLRPVVDIFGQKCQLPYFTSKVGDNLSKEKQSLDVRKIIDDHYPKATRCFSDMMYLQLLVEYKKNNKDYAIKTSREVEIEGKKYKISLSDIKPVHELEHVVDGVKYVFREVSALEWAKLGSPRFEDVLKYAFQHLEFEGKKYKLEDTEEGELPYELNFKVQEIMGTIQIVLEDGCTVTGLEKIEELFIVGKI